MHKAALILFMGAALGAMAPDAGPAPFALPDRPEAWFVAEAGGQAIVIDGQTLDPRVQYIIAQEQAAEAARGDPPGDPGATPEGRAAARAAFDRRWASRTRVTADMAWVRDLDAPGRGGPIPVRVYRPAAEGELPVIVYFHGGGWILGGIDGADRAVRLIANEARAIIVSVGYRLAPEHSYPAAWEDAEDAYAWAEANAASWGGDAARLAVGGDSAGGNLAIATSTRRLDAGRHPPAYQLLYYPAVDMSREYPSWRLFGQGFGLDSGFADYVIPRAFPAGGLDAPEISPVRAADPARMPPTIIAIAGFDILRDSENAYAARLGQAGVPVTRFFYPSLIHGFLQLSGPVPAADAAAREPARALGEALRAERPGN